MAKKAEPYCQFRLTTRLAKRTETWDVYTVEGNFHLGIVKWYSAWRRYCFFAGQNTLYDPTCLREIAEFAEKATKDHKENRP